MTTFAILSTTGKRYVCRVPAICRAQKDIRHKPKPRRRRKIVTNGNGRFMMLPENLMARLKNLAKADVLAPLTMACGGDLTVYLFYSQILLNFDRSSQMYAAFS